MTKANANAAANAQEQQAAQQQILRDLLALGKKNGRLTLKEISDALSHLELSSEDIDKVYETLETMGIEVETNGVLEKVIGDDDDSFEPEEVEEVPEEELVDTSAMAETFAIDDPVRMYLKEIGKVDLLSPEEEVTLAERMQKGNEAAERIANEGDAIPAEERAQLEKDIKLGDRAKKRLAEANLRLVVSIAKRYVGRGMLFLDLIQEGNLGLIKAVEKFDSTKGFKSLPTQRGGSVRRSPVRLRIRRVRSVFRYTWLRPSTRLSAFPASCCRSWATIPARRRSPRR